LIVVHGGGRFPCLDAGGEVYSYRIIKIVKTRKKKEKKYCTILINSSVTRHGPSKIDEMSRLSRSFWRSDEIIWQLCAEYGIFSSPAAPACRNFRTCHGKIGRLPKPYFRQVRHASRCLTN
jgi:hypothetical protein